jgi:formate hydrogenlyase subunit 4
MQNILLSILGYISSWVLMLVTLMVALFAESTHTYISGKSLGRRGMMVSLLPLRDIFRSMTIPISLPEASAVRLSIYLPCFALAALIPIAASIPFFSFLPIMDNGGDLIQIIQFAALSETLAILSVLSLGTPSARNTADRMAKELAMLIIPMIAAFISIAFYYSASGVKGDPFSLNVFTTALHMSPSTPFSLAGTIIFIFVIFSQIPHSNAGFGCSLLENCELPDFNGVPRSMLQLWSIFRAFLAVALVTHIFFPWGYFKGLNAGFSISWWAQSVNFAAFWTTVLLMRVFGVTLCWKVMDMLEKVLRIKNSATWICIILTTAATLLVVYEGIKISMEVAAC